MPRMVMPWMGVGRVAMPRVVTALVDTAMGAMDSGWGYAGGAGWRGSG